MRKRTPSFYSSPKLKVEELKPFGPSEQLNSREPPCCQAQDQMADWRRRFCPDKPGRSRRITCGRAVETYGPPLHCSGTFSHSPGGWPILWCCQERGINREKWTPFSWVVFPLFGEETVSTSLTMLRRPTLFMGWGNKSLCQTAPTNPDYGGRILRKSLQGWGKASCTGEERSLGFPVCRSGEASARRADLTESRLHTHTYKEKPLDERTPKF